MEKTSTRKAVPSSSAKLLIKQLLPLGIPLGRLLKKTGLSAVWFDDKDSLITPDEYQRIIENALDETGDPSLGLNLGKYANPADAGVWGYAILSSSTLEEANRVATQYWELNGALVKLSHSRNENFHSWQILPAFPTSNRRVWIYAVEELLSVFYTSAGLLTAGAFQYTNIQLSYPDPGHGDLYRKMFQCMVDFNCDACSFQTAADILKMSTRCGQPQIAAYCEEECERLLKKMKGTDDFIESIQRMILCSPRSTLKLNDAASKLSMSSRTLRRRLRERNRTFQQTIDEVRAEIAKKYLLTTNLSVDQLSERFGYSESSTFRRAFKKWTGMNICEFKKSK